RRGRGGIGPDHHGGDAEGAGDPAELGDGRIRIVGGGDAGAEPPLRLGGAEVGGPGGEGAAKRQRGGGVRDRGDRQAEGRVEDRAVDALEVHVPHVEVGVVAAGVAVVYGRPALRLAGAARPRGVAGAEVRAFFAAGHLRAELCQLPLGGRLVEA